MYIYIHVYVYNNLIFWIVFENEVPLMPMELHFVCQCLPNSHSGFGKYSAAPRLDLRILVGEMVIVIIRQEYKVLYKEY